jgi:hypothetical protein
VSWRGFLSSVGVVSAKFGCKYSPRRLEDEGVGHAQRISSRITVKLEVFNPHADDGDGHLGAHAAQHGVELEMSFVVSRSIAETPSRQAGVLSTTATTRAVVRYESGCPAEEFAV